MSRVRGKHPEIRISSWPIRAFVDRIDILMPLSPGIRDNILRRISEETVITCGSKEMGGRREPGGSLVDVDIVQIAKDIEVGFCKLCCCRVIIGLIGGLNGQKVFMTRDLPEKRRYRGKEQNCSRERYEVGCALVKGDSILLPPAVSSAHRVVMNGTDAISLGSCRRMPYNSLSHVPSHGVLTYMAQKAEEMGIVVEQAEDELAKINMALGPLCRSEGNGFHFRRRF